MEHCAALVVSELQYVPTGVAYHAELSSLIQREKEILLSCTLADPNTNSTSLFEVAPQ